MDSRTPEFFNTYLWEWDDPAYSSGTENNSPGSPRANQQGDCPAAGRLCLYGTEPGASNHPEAGAEEQDSSGLPGRAAEVWGEIMRGMMNIPDDSSGCPPGKAPYSAHNLL